MSHRKAVLIILPMLAVSPVCEAWGQTFTAEQEGLFARTRALQDEIIKAPGAKTEPGDTQAACSELRRVNKRLYDIAVEKGESYTPPIALAWCKKGEPGSGKPTV